MNGGDGAQLLQLQCKDTIQQLPQYAAAAQDSVYCITSQKFHKVCRTCLAEDGDNSCLFDMAYDNKAAVEILKFHAAVQVERGDYLPQNMCSNCLEDLFRTYSFVRKCQQSDTVLRYILESDLEDVKGRKDVSAAAGVEGSNQPLEDALDVKIKPKDSDDPDDLREVVEAAADEDNSSDSQDNEDTDFSVKTKPKRKRSKRRRNVQIRHNFSKTQRLPFKCRDCSEIYDSYEKLRTHRRDAKHPEVRNHACMVCAKTFTSSKLRQHMRAHTKEKPYQCKVCFQGFSMSGNLKRHMMTHTGERPHVCEICGKGFIQATTLQNHKKTHAKYERIGGDANSPHFVCNYCGRGFKRLARYNAHLKKHFSESDGSGGDVKKSPPTQEDEPREHICMICKRAYKTKHLLKAHQLTHGEKTFLCSECGKGFVTKAALQSHLKVHTGEKPHTCNVCKKSFAHVGSFEAHMLIHTGQKPYNCNICTKAFTQLSHLKYHLRTHSGERPYICSFCGKSFALKGNLTVHIRTHTGETPYICSVCGKGFYDSSSMKKHKRGHGDVITVQPLQSTSMPIVGNVGAGNVDVVNSINYVGGVNAMIV